MKSKPVVALRKPPEELPAVLDAERQARLDAFVRGVDTVTSQEVNKSTSQQSAKSQDFRRSTYYLRPEQIRAMKVRAATEGRNVSELVREAFDAYLAKV